MSVRRKCASLLEYFNNPFAAIPPPPQDDALPAAKRPRLEASTSVSTAEDAADADIFFDADTYVYAEALTASPDDTLAVAPIDAATMAASLPNARASRVRAPPRKWTPEEDAKLTDAVNKHGDNNWVAVAARVPGRTNAQCRHRWAKCLDPTNEHTVGKWTEEEDAKLTDAVTELGEKSWAAVAALVPSRTNTQCSQRWFVCLDPTVRRASWTSVEDAKLTEAVTELGGSEWAAVSALVPGRTNTQCRQRWTKLEWRPAGNKGKRWTEEEDTMLIDAVKEHGDHNWIAVAALVPGRTNAQCCCRHHSRGFTSFRSSNH
jgi:hypothetical protein